MLLQPKNRKYRKDQSGGCKFSEKTQTDRLVFGCYGLKALESPRSGYLKASVIEAVRRVLIRKIRKIGKIWIRIFPYKPITQKPTKTRMGKGKGNVQFWACPIKQGQILFELSSNLPMETIKKVFEQATHKVPFKTKFVYSKSVNPIK